MSSETTKARSAALYAGCLWKSHRASCARCAESVKRGSPKTPCRQGLPLWLAHQSAEKSLTLSIALDRLPSPDQDALFDVSELNPAGAS